MLITPVLSWAGVIDVILVDSISGLPASSVRVTAKENLRDGKLKWVASGYTDGAGRVSFDLDGLGTGRTYLFAAKVYNGLTSYSRETGIAGEFVFPVGCWKSRL